MVHNVFVSRPTDIGPEFETAYLRFEKYIRGFNIEPRRLGAGDYTLDAPLTGVIELMNQCEGAIVLGYPQLQFSASLFKGGTRQQHVEMNLPTPWNHIEAALAFRQHIPVLIISHEKVSGGVFDPGVTGQFVMATDFKAIDWCDKEEFQGVFHAWRSNLGDP